MSSNPLAGGPCCPVGRNLALVALLITASVSTTGWVLTATRDRTPVQPPAQPPAPLDLPPQRHLYSVQLDAGLAVLKLVKPDSRVNVLATLRQDDRLQAFPLLVNVRVVAVDTNPPHPRDGASAAPSEVLLAVREKEALVLSLAKSRGCNLSLLLLNSSEDSEMFKYYKIDDVIEKLVGRRPQPIHEGERPPVLTDPAEVAPAPRPKGEDQ
ncbi:MAG: hypothetical protein K2V38_06640 [Gemmataceae bacterium]|nr:hypothetical protein [Gemmataceae bacterium]